MPMTCSQTTGRRFATFLALAVSCGGAALAQTPLAGSGGGGPVRMINADWAILEEKDPRQDIACEVTPIKPVLGFDMRFHAGYDVTIPLKDLAGSENILTMIFRVTPDGRPEDARYFVQRIRVPEIAADAGGSAYIQGVFDVGEGKYQVDWLMRDRSERFCSNYWDAEAVLGPKDKQMNLQIAAATVEPADGQQFKDEPPIERLQTEPPLNVKVLINFAPQREHSTTLQPLDTAALVAILRGISREPRIGRFSIVAFNLHEQRIIYRQENSNRIDFPALGQALDTLNLGTIDLKRLSQKHGETDFLTNLIQSELGGEGQPDALIFAGPKAMLEQNVPTDSLKEVGDVEFPVFYMNYNLQPQQTPWRDAIGRAVKFFRGYEFTISRPRDLWSAMSDMVGRIVRFKNNRRDSGAASQ
jgi:hypothetical protein